MTDGDYLERQFHVGDRCRIRQWDDMAAEFGYERRSDDYDDEDDDEDGDVIDCQYSFTTPMKYLCGQKFTIAEICGCYYHSEEGIEYSRGSGDWSISADMLEYDYEYDDCRIDPQSVALAFALIDAL